MMSLSMKKLLAASAIAIALVLGLSQQSKAAPIVFTHVCTSLAACDNDADFAFSITLDSTVVSANGSYDTTSDGGAAFLGWTAASSVGNGFAIGGDLTDVVGADDGLTFVFDSASIPVSIVENVSAVTSFGFRNLGVGQVTYGDADRFTSRFDLAPIVGDSDRITPNWTAIPEPTTLALCGTGLTAIACARRRVRRTTCGTRQRL